MDIENRIKEIKKIKRKKEIGSSPKKKLKGSLGRVKLEVRHKPPN